MTDRYGDAARPAVPGRDAVLRRAAAGAASSGAPERRPWQHRGASPAQAGPARPAAPPRGTRP